MATAASRRSARLSSNSHCREVTATRKSKEWLMVDQRVWKANHPPEAHWNARKTTPAKPAQAAANRKAFCVSRSSRRYIRQASGAATNVNFEKSAATKKSTESCQRSD